MPPPLVGAGLVAWYKGDAGITSASGVISQVADQSGYGQDLDVVTAGKEPATGVDTLDGINGITFTPGTAGRFIARAASLVDSSAATIGPSHDRTVFAVFMPRSDSGSGTNITGGPVSGFRDSPCFETLFDLESTFHADGFYLFDTAWRFSGGSCLGPDTVRTVYENIGTCCEWRGRSTTGATVAAAVNGAADLVLTPSVSAGVTGAPPSGFVLGNADNTSSLSHNFQGPIFEYLVYDHIVTAGTRALVLAYLAARFPSIGIVVPPASTVVISPRRTIVTPGARLTFSASGGTGSLVYSFAAGGNRSGGSIDSTTGDYEAGARGAAEDLIVVTDSLAATDTAEVSVAGTLYRSYQSKTPAGPQGPNLKLIERVFGGEKDIQFERARQASLVGLLGIGPDGQVDSIGEGRLLPRALTESPADEGGANDTAYGDRLRQMWTNKHGHRRAGGHEGMLRALDRAGFPMGDPDGAHVIQKTKLVSYLNVGVVTFFDHTGWLFDWRGPELWGQFGILFGADFTPPIGTTFQDGDPSADLLNRLIKQWKPPKSVFMGTWVVVSGPTWGWPVGVTWGMGGRVWGGGSTRFVSPT